MLAADFPNFPWLVGSNEEDWLGRYDPLPRAPEVFRLLVWLALLFESEAISFKMIQAMAKMTSNVCIKGFLLLKTTRMELGSGAWELPAGIRLETWVLLSNWLVV